MPFAALPLLLTAAGTAVQQIGANETDRERRRAFDANIRRQADINNRASQRVSQEIQRTAAANPDEERMVAQNDFMDALRKAKAADGGDDLLAPAGGSDRFSADVGQARTSMDAEGRALAGNLAAIDAPQYSRVNDARSFADTATDLSLLGRESAGQDFLSQLRLAHAAGRGAGLESLGGGLAAFGQASASRAQKPKPVKLSPSSGFVGPR